MHKKIPGPSSQQLIDSFPDPFVVIDRDYRIVTANQRYAQHYGVGREALAGRHCYEVSHRIDRPCSEHGEHCPLDELFRSGEALQVMHVHRDAQGNEEHVQVNATPLFDEQGQPQFMGESIVPIRNTLGGDFVVGESESMQLLVQQVERVAQTRTTVLLVGESGTGKECLSHFIHSQSSRAEQPFVIFDCAASGDAGDIDQRLFGAVDPASGELLTEGVFQQADGGTLFIDEISELPPGSQLKLLRVLECGEVQPVGEQGYRSVDVRLLIASHADLPERVEAGGLRKDLYYRLSAFPVQVPPLRERRRDIVSLARHFLQTFQPEERLRVISPSFREAMLSHDYPGNVRELRNLVERAVIYAAGDPLQPEHLVFDHQLFAKDADLLEQPVFRDLETRRLLARRSGGPSDAEILDVLREHKGHRRRAAGELGISERTLYRHLKRLRQV